MKTHLSFEEALQQTSGLLSDCQSGAVAPEELEERISRIISTGAGARGFLVNYLTSDLPFADDPQAPVLNALKNGPDVLFDLLAKNLVMSTTMAVTHQRNDDADGAKGSLRVQRRTSEIIRLLRSDKMNQRLEEMWRSVTQGSGEFADFLQRWHYDEEQLQKAQEAIKPLRAAK